MYYFMEKRNGYGYKGIKLSHKIRYFACVNGGSLAREESLLEGRPINAVVLDLFGAMKKRENQLNISSRSLPFLKPACVCVHAAQCRRKTHRPLGDPAIPNVSLSVTIWPRAK